MLSDGQVRSEPLMGLTARLCVLRDAESGEQWHNYRLCNLIGLVDVFDMSASELHPDSPPEIAYLFNSIVVTEEKSQGHDLFRPAGRMSQILMSEGLKAHIERQNKYDHLEFIEPEEFA